MKGKSPVGDRPPFDSMVEAVEIKGAGVEVEVRVGVGLKVGVGTDVGIASDANTVNDWVKVVNIPDASRVFIIIVCSPADKLAGGSYVQLPLLSAVTDVVIFSSE